MVSVLFNPTTGLVTWMPKSGKDRLDLPEGEHRQDMDADTQL